MKLPSDVLALQQALAGRYSIERELGRGGMGTVLLARDVALDRLVAIKLLPAAMAKDPKARERFLSEARTAAGLSHPNIVPIHSVEEQGDLVFFVMGYVDGETLGERVARNGPVSPRFAMRMMQEVSWALGYAHQRGVVHRDIKPDNIMIESGSDRALVTDFGIAQVESAEAQKPSGEVIGTARYMSPEQACGDVVDGRSDLYSLGGTFFFALTGKPPFEGKNLPAILAKQVTQPAPSVLDIRPEIPERLASIIGQCLQKAPDDRLPSGEEVADKVGEVKGRDFRAPPLVRSFVRNAEVSTMVLIASIVAGQASVGGGNVNISLGGPGFIGTILLIQLLLLARRLLREGYVFEDIQSALHAEAQVQEEEANAVLGWKWLRKLDGFWHRLWTGKLGRKFFDIAGWRLERPEQVLVSRDATELVLGRAAIDLVDDLTVDQRRQVGDAREVIESLEHRAEKLRAGKHSGEALANTVAAMENIRLALLRLKAGEASVQDLTLHLENARKISEEVSHQVEARRDVNRALGLDST